MRNNLARIHKLLSNYCNLEFKSKGSKSSIDEEE